MKKLIFIFPFVLLVACTGRLAVMKNDTGDVKRCEVSAGSEMLTGAYMSGVQQDRCIAGLEAAGYKKVK